MRKIRPMQLAPVTGTNACLVTLAARERGWPMLQLPERAAA
jgi:hypothetical protein